MNVLSGVATKVLMIGLDVGDGHLIRQWAEQGYLPVLRSVIESGTWGWCDTTAASLHVSAWPSLYTGTMPGKHGVYYTFQPVPGQQGYRRFAADQYGEPTFWQLLSRAGKKCSVFDAPYTHPDAGFNGIQIFDWGTWAHYWKPMSCPSALLRRLRKQCGRYPLELEAHDLGLASLDPTDLTERLVRSVQVKTEATVWLMQESPWDLFFMVFGETHPAAHYCWSDGSGADERDGQALNTLCLRRLYQEIDRGIGRILGHIDDRVTVFITSGDGMGPNYSGWHLLPQVLRQLDLFVSTDDERRQPSAPAASDGGKKDLIKRFRDLLPKDFRKTLARQLPTKLRDMLAQRVDTANIDWSQTRAYCLPTDLEGYVRINVKGREPAGIVEPGAEYRNLCAALTTQLHQLVNPATGRPAVRRVIHAEEAFPGARRQYLPDLIVLWSQECDIAALSSPDVGTVCANSPDARAGTHSPPGFVVVRGSRLHEIPENAHIVDIAPTLLAQFGISPSRQMDGKAWTAVGSS